MGRFELGQHATSNKDRLANGCEGRKPFGHVNLSEAE